MAVLRVAVEIIPRDGDLVDSWFIPGEERWSRCMRRVDYMSKDNKTSCHQRLVTLALKAKVCVRTRVCACVSPFCFWISY